MGAGSGSGAGGVKLNYAVGSCPKALIQFSESFRYRGRNLLAMHLSYPGRPGTRVTNLFVEREGSGVRFSPKNMDFSLPCTLKLVYPDGTEEIITFTQIRDGQASLS